LDIVVGQQCGEPLLRQTPLNGLAADPITELLKLRNIQTAKPIILRRRQHHGNVTILPANDDRLALGCIEQGREPLFRFGG
jgi:hypothetical protein